MENEKTFEQLANFIDKEIKGRRYKGQYQTWDIINNLFEAHPHYTLEQYKALVPKYLNKEENEERNFNNSPEKKFENSKKSSQSTKNRRDTDPEYRKKNNKDKCDWEKKQLKNNPEYREKRNAAKKLARKVYNAIMNSTKVQTCFLKEGRCIRQKVINQYLLHKICPLSGKFLLCKGKCHPL